MTEPSYWTRTGSHLITRREVVRGAALGTAGLAAAALIGCSGGDDAPSAPAGTAGPAGAAAGAPKKGGRVATFTNGDPNTLDLHGASSSSSSFPISPAYNQLVQFDPAVAVERSDKIVADIAKSWEVQPDGLTYNFKLIPNAKFHDGPTLTSADVKASLERVQNPPKGVVSLRRLQLAGMTFTTPDASTLVIKLANPKTPSSMLSILAQGWMTIGSAKDIAASFDYTKKVNGTGPYRFIEYLQGNRVKLDRFADYHNQPYPYPDGFDCYIIVEPQTAVAQMESGALHQGMFTKDDQAALKQRMGNKATYVEHAAYSAPIMHFGVKKAPYSDQRVRLAISSAIDRQGVVDVVRKGDGSVGGYMLPTGSWGLTLEEVQKVPGYAPVTPAVLAEAKKLLAAAGVADGFVVDLPVRTESRDTPVFLADQLAKIGLKGNVNVLERATMAERLANGEFDIAADTIGYTLDDPDAVFSENYLGDAARNYSRLPSTSWDHLYKQQTVEMDPQKRAAIVKQMQKEAMTTLGGVILNWSVYRWVINNKLKNYTPHNSQKNSNRSELVWLDPSA